jgi:hypothetical protein
LIDLLAIKLLGLEPGPYASASGRERSSILLVLISFMVVLLGAIVATYIIGLFVSGNFVVAVPIAVIGTFVLISIFRFSLILIKPRISLVDTINQKVIRTSFKEKWEALKKWWHDRIQGKGLPGSFVNSPIPGFTTVFRLFYLGLLACVIIFPLTVLLHWEASMNYNLELRAKALEEYRKSERMFEKKSGEINSGYSFERKMSRHEAKVNRSYFTMKLFIRALSYPSFTMVCVFVLLCFFVPHFLLFQLMRNQNYTYINSVNGYFKDLITENYSQLEKEATRIVIQKNKTGIQTNLSFLTKDNPYLEEEEAPESAKNVSWKEWQKIIQQPPTTLSPQ